MKEHEHINFIQSLQVYLYLKDLSLLWESFICENSLEDCSHGLDFDIDNSSNWDLWILADEIYFKMHLCAVGLGSAFVMLFPIRLNGNMMKATWRTKADFQSLKSISEALVSILNNLARPSFSLDLSIVSEQTQGTLGEVDSLASEDHRPLAEIYGCVGITK
mgnify:CR=1 FL=1